MSEFHELISDLRTLLLEEREKCATFFSSAESMKRFPAPSLTPPHKPNATPVTNKSKTPYVAPPLKKEEPKPLPFAPEKPAPKAAFALEPHPVDETSFLDRSTIAKRTQKLFPGWKLAQQPPSDEEAVQIASSWKIRGNTTQILVLSLTTQGSSHAFLTNLTAAIQRLIAPAQLIDARAIEKENMWEAVLNVPTLKAIFAPPLETWKCPRLLQWVKTNPVTNESSIGSSRLHLLQETETYLQSPEKKRLLWQHVCRLFRP